MVAHADEFVTIASWLVPYLVTPLHPCRSALENHYTRVHRIPPFVYRHLRLFALLEVHEHVADIWPWSIHKPNLVHTPPRVKCLEL